MLRSKHVGFYSPLVFKVTALQALELIQIVYLLPKPNLTMLNIYSLDDRLYLHLMPKRCRHFLYLIYISAFNLSKEEGKIV